MILELADKQFMNQQSISLSVQPVGKTAARGRRKQPVIIIGRLCRVFGGSPADYKLYITMFRRK